MAVDSVHPQLAERHAQYDLIEDCLAGAEAVKRRGDLYLPRPNVLDTSDENKKRYLAYIQRAVFVNVAAQTLNGMLGQIFMRDPQVDIPAVLDALKTDADGSGIGLSQLAENTTRNTLAFGRCGLFVDYPKTDGEATTLADLESGNIQPTISLYHSRDIINWHTRKVGAKMLLSQVRLRERYVELADNGFDEEVKEQFRVLRLDNDGSYVVDIYRNNELFDSFVPLDGNGNTFAEIPFQFVGADNNDVKPDKPPMYDLCELNIAHYRNSADYQESCFINGQATLYFAGLTEDWVKEVLGGVIRTGSRSAIALPAGASGGMLQAAANSMPFESMQHLERQMISLGAKLVEQASVQRTAYEAGLDATAENSLLSSVAKNVAAAFVQALVWAARYVRALETGIVFDLNTEFDLIKLTPEERSQLLKEYQANVITFSEYRASLRRGGIATLDDEEAKTEIENDQARLAALFYQPESTTEADTEPGSDANDTVTGDGG